MKALLCKAFGAPDTLVCEDVPDPVPGPGQALIAMKAAGVNFPDVLLVQGKYQLKPPLPFAAGSELAGIVLALGDGVKNVKVGDRVIASCRYGAFAEKVVAQASHLIPLPKGIGFDLGASFTLVYGTSYHALKDRAALKAGETLLVLGAAGGVGLAAIQIGKALGARVIAAASTPEKLAICRESGADETINYTTEDLRERLKELTGGKGPDVIYDPVGGKYTEPAFRSIAWRGRYLVIGFADGEIPSLPLNLPLLKGASIVGAFWGEFVSRELPNFVKDLTDMFGLIAQGKLRPHISARYPLADGAKALNDLVNRKATGKVVITNGDPAEATLVADGARAAEAARVAEVARATGAPDTTRSVSESGAATATRTKRQPADLAALVGQEIGVSSWFTVDQKRIDAFAHCTEDHQWIHVDVERAAKESPFGGTVAHGLLTLALLPATSYDILLELIEVRQSLNYGLQKVRFLAPVRAGKRVRNHIRIVALEPRGPGRWLLTTENTFEIEGEDKPALIAQALGLLMS